MKREKLDPYWHKSRVAARIILKARQGHPLSARDKRLAALFASDHGVENRLIQQGLYGFCPEILRAARERAKAA